jgi:hypothetical protein
VTRAQLLAWLDTRRPAPPATLRARLEASLSGADLPLPEHLARLGRVLLDGVASRPEGRRELALDLLAADALITYAFEAQAEEAVEGVARLAAGVAW